MVDWLIDKTDFHLPVFPVLLCVYVQLDSGFTTGGLDMVVNSAVCKLLNVSQARALIDYY